MPAPAPARRHDPDSHADQALAAIADLLSTDGYSLSIPALDGDAYLRTTNALRAHTAMTITPHGNLTWEYRSADYARLNPSRLAGVAIGILDPDRTRPEPPIGTNDGFPLAEVIRYALYRYGLTATVTETSAGLVLAAANPGQPYRGTITITDDGELTWHVRAPHHPDGGIPLPDIAATITSTLTRAHHTPL